MGVRIQEREVPAISRVPGLAICRCPNSRADFWPQRTQRAQRATGKVGVEAKKRLAPRGHSPLEIIVAEQKKVEANKCFAPPCRIPPCSQRLSASSASLRLCVRDCGLFFAGFASFAAKRAVWLFGDTGKSANRGIGKSPGLRAPDS